MLKTLGIILWNFQGHGVARVVIQLLPIFRRMGMRCVVMTGNGPGVDTLLFPAAYTRLFQSVLKGERLQEAYSAREYQLTLRTLANHVGVAVERLRSWCFIFERGKGLVRLRFTTRGGL